MVDLEIVLLFFLGLVFGSFINALVYRVKYNSVKKNIPKLSIVNGRSICPNCKHQLQSIDLIPLLSWIFLRGKCRYCHKSISIQYPLVEIVTALLFVFSFIYWKNGFNLGGYVELAIWLLILTLLISLAIYDIRWKIIPTKIIYLIYPLVIANDLINIYISKDFFLFLGYLLGFLILGGLFYLLFQISSGKWIGGGDVRLGFLLGLLVGGPLSSILLLFLASVIGTISSIPFVLSGRLKKKSTIPFGPFLIIGATIVYFFGTQIINWYKSKL